MDIEQIQKQFIADLIGTGMSEKEAIDTANVFSIAWVKSNEGKEVSIDQYREKVEEFLRRLKA